MHACSDNISLPSPILKEGIVPGFRPAHLWVFLSWKFYFTAYFPNPSHRIIILFTLNVPYDNSSNHDQCTKFAKRTRRNDLCWILVHYFTLLYDILSICRITALFHFFRPPNRNEHGGPGPSRMRDVREYNHSTTTSILENKERWSNAYPVSAASLNNISIRTVSRVMFH